MVIMKTLLIAISLFIAFSTSAQATTYARKIGTLIVEPQPSQNETSYRSRFSIPPPSNWGENPVIVQVPDGVQHDALFLGSWPSQQMDPTKYRNPDGTNANGTVIEP